MAESFKVLSVFIPYKETKSGPFLTKYGGPFIDDKWTTR